MAVAGSGGQWQRGIVSVIAAEADPCGRNGVAAAVWQRRQTAAAGQGRPWVINQRVSRAYVRVRRPGVLTYAAIIEVGVGGRRVDVYHVDFMKSILRVVSKAYTRVTDACTSGPSMYEVGTVLV